MYQNPNRIGFEMPGQQKQPGATMGSYGGRPTYGNGQQISGLGDQMQGYGSMGQQITGQPNTYLLDGGMSQYPGMGGGMSPGFYQPEMPMPGYGFQPRPMPMPMPGYGYSPRPMPQPTYRPGGFPQPDGGGAMNPGFGGGMMPQPDGGGEMNPGYAPMPAPIPSRTFNNNNPFYNAKGNLRMRYRPGGQGPQGGGFGQPTGY